jgi:putative heme-binding domain-containing protein
VIRVPGGWKDDAEKRFEKYDGFAWYRCFVKVPESWRGTDLQVAFYQLSNSIEVFWNGEKIGAAGVMPPDFRAAYGTNVRYTIPARKVVVGQASSLAIRVYDQGGRGGFKTVAPAIVQGNDAILLEGNWQFRTGDELAWAKSDATNVADGVVFDAVVDFATITAKAGVPAGPLSPKDALATMVVPDDLEIEQVLAEPEVGQPLSISFDERGRMWVVQYLQYPDPAGLTVISRDKFWRVVYDKVPPPPPNHFKGRDKITIHEDSDGDGVFDKHKTFVDGLNIATACARGRGGVWVMNPPYLLFYPDKNNDDVPDGDPVVHLEGFGMEDTHSVASSLTWGPDGWLYASQGSTVSGNIVRPGLDKQPVHSMGQLIWRYHPETRRYEIFAEGGGNAFGVAIDSKGRVYSGHNGGDTRGFHYVQGGYFQKGFNKHGPLSNPYTFGYFNWMKHHAVPRFSHTFVIYEGNTLPEPYRGRLFGVVPLLSHVVMSDVSPDGSTYQTKDVGHAVTTKDTYFRPVDIKVGPDGALYVADFYEERIAHLVHHDGQIDPSTGRIYRVKAKTGVAVAESATPRPGLRGLSPSHPFDLSKLSTKELVDVLRHENKWFRHSSLRLIGDRKDKSIVPLLKDLIDESDGQFALECLWALNLTGGFEDTVAAKTIQHNDPHVRLWTVRLLCDERKVSPRVATLLAQMAVAEPNVQARNQLACSAKRLPAEQCLPIVRNLLTHSEDSSDVHLPLLLWWAIESKCESDRDPVLKMFDDSTIWNLPVVQSHIEERLMRRFAAAGSQADLAACARLLQLAPGEGHVKQLMTGFEKAYAGRALAGLPDELAEALAQHAGKSVVLGLRQGQADAVEAALKVIGDGKADKTEQLQYIQILGEVNQPSCVPVLLQVVSRGGDDSLRGAALTSLQKYDDPRIPATVIDAYPKFNDDLKSVAQTLLASRASSTIQFLDAIDAGKIDPKSVPPEVVQKFTLHRDDRIGSLVAKHWGELKPATSEELEREVGRLAGIIRSSAGSPAAGKKIFMNQCGKCHKLFDQGGQIGPDLTSYKRDDVESLLLHVVNPSAEIREGFENFLIATTDGRTLSGFLADQTNRLVILRGQDGQNITIPRDEIDEMVVTKASLMPEGQLKQYNDQQLRDLFAYLRSSQPLNE